jgi:hypothetical protein
MVVCLVQNIQRMIRSENCLDMPVSMRGAGQHIEND